MKTQAHVDLVHDYADVIWNKQQLHRMPEFMRHDVRLHGLGGEPPIIGVDKLTEETARWLGLYSAVHMKVIRTVAEANRVAWQWELNGTIADVRLFAPPMRTVVNEIPQAKDVVVYGISISTFQDGLIAEEVTQSGIAEFLKQMGYPPKD
jgi:SnoaL-like domain